MGESWVWSVNPECGVWILSVECESWVWNVNPECRVWILSVECESWVWSVNPECGVWILSVECESWVWSVNPECGVWILSVECEPCVIMITQHSTFKTPDSAPCMYLNGESWVWKDQHSMLRIPPFKYMECGVMSICHKFGTRYKVDCDATMTEQWTTMWRSCYIEQWMSHVIKQMHLLDCDPDNFALSKLCIRLARTGWIYTSKVYFCWVVKGHHSAYSVLRMSIQWY